MNSYILTVLIVGIFTSVGCSQNVPNHAVYLLFDDSSQEKCEQNINNQIKKDLKRYRKVDTRKELTFFYVCNELFVFEKKLKTPDTTSIKKVPNDKIVDIDEMIKKYKSLKPQQFKHQIYDTLYIVEKLQEGQVLLYRVGWNDRSLGIVN